MITGTVTSVREAVLGLTVYAADGQSQSTSAIVDTGFTGWLTLPPDIIVTLGLTWRRSTQAIFADGNSVPVDVYEAAVEWDGQVITIPIAEANADPLVGMSLMYGFELWMPIIDGGMFTLRRIGISP